MAGVASSSNQTFQSAATSDRRKSSPKFRSFHPICPSMASHEAAAQSENTCDKSQSWPLARAQIIDWKSGRSVLAGQEHLPLRNALPSVCLDHWQQGWPHVQLQDAPGSGCFICDRSAPSTQTMAEKSSTFPARNARYAPGPKPFKPETLHPEPAAGPTRTGRYLRIQRPARISRLCKSGFGIRVTLTL
ncbi:unnamed protein product [Symbiodinium microadriaticum]|nr:unnamed protein product [Symbiodinium microadriaticum]CAE7877499.1 unnamed protein product [Symbiodinium sp. KB8]